MVQDIDNLAVAIQQGFECSELLAAMEQQARLLVDISSDMVRATALSKSSVNGRKKKSLDEGLESGCD